MSDLSRLRKRWLRIEQTGKRLKRERDDLKALRLDGAVALTRTEERRLLRLDAEIEQARKDWTRIRDAIRAEETRLIADPDAFLRFT